MTMSILLSKKVKRDKATDVSISINESMVKAIDSVRGDTNRSLWLRRAAARELERLKNDDNQQRNRK